MSKVTKWYERLGVSLHTVVEGEKGFVYEIGFKREVDGSTWIYIAKVVKDRAFAKTILRIPATLANRIADAIAGAAVKALRPPTETK